MNFDESEAAQKCVEALQGMEFKGKVLYAGRAQKKTERQVGHMGGGGKGGKEGRGKLGRGG